MRFAIQFLPVGVIALASTLWCQQSDTASPKDPYLEHLRTVSTEDSTATQASPSAKDGVESYKQHLRCLAQAGGTSEASIDCSHPAIAVNSREHDHSATPAPTPEAGPVGESQPKSVPVKMTSTSEPGKSSKDHGATGLPSEHSCSDSYCEQLRRVAEGNSPAVDRPDLIPSQNRTTERNFLKNLAFDQLHIWSSPFQLRPSDATWAVPFGIVTGSLIVTDHDLSKQLAQPGRLDVSKKISNYGLYSFLGAGAGAYGIGLITHDDHKRETGLLSGEAFINATLVAEALKLSFGRERPFEGDHFGHIGRGGSSFPSEHAMGSFAVASVIAREYPNPFVQIGAYGLASAVAVTRVTAGQHFPSDVFVGSALGYLIGQKIYKDHHSPELPGTSYGTFIKDETLNPSTLASAYVPLDSWVYSAVDRLIALGYINDAMVSMRPWTRLEVARFVSDARERFGESAQADESLRALETEFLAEGKELGGAVSSDIQLDHVYTRVTEIAGPPLRDGYHFAQTIRNDYGRPFAEGVNFIAGFDAHGSSGPIAFYFRGEYQRSPEAPSLSPSAQAAIFREQFFIPTSPLIGTEAVSRPRIIEGYLSTKLAGYQISIGKQSLWLGPEESGPLLYSNNSEPLPMIRFDQTTPYLLPGFLSFLGKVRTQLFVGRLGGQRNFLNVSTPKANPDQPLLHGEAISFKPTPNFEFGLLRTTIFGGPGVPVTFHNFARSMFSSSGSLTVNSNGTSSDPGDRRSDFNFQYRLPKLRHVSFYGDMFTDDEIFPLAFPRKSAINSGLYFSRLPRVPKLDLRLEGGTSNTMSPLDLPWGFFYFNVRFFDGYTNYGNLVGSAMGRQSQLYSAQTRYWFSPRSTLKAGWRHQKIARELLLGGGTVDDFWATTQWNLDRDFTLGLSVQAENWKIPVLNSSSQRNYSTTLELSIKVPKLIYSSEGP